MNSQRNRPVAGSALRDGEGRKGKGTVSVRKYDRLPLDVSILFRGSTGGYRKGLLKNLSLTGCYIEPVRRVDFLGWVRLRIDGDEDRRITGIEPVETWGLMARKDDVGFAIHFNWIERENLRRLRNRSSPN